MALDKRLIIYSSLFTIKIISPYLSNPGIKLKFNENTKSEENKKSPKTTNSKGDNTGECKNIGTERPTMCNVFHG